MTEPTPDPRVAELKEAMARIVDALAYMRDPMGNLIYLTPDDRIKIAFHLARAGTDVHPERAVIKAVGVPPAPGQFADTVDWVPIDAQVDPTLPQPVTAVGPVPTVADLDAALPWHTKTKIKGDFR